ncbi:HTH domain-containing protein [Haloferax sp. DFSO52]|uniref:HTH domain-containing protein n=1 Tax=Haloferax sp. DFSO52 TaxID=3388505 RepID=UPI003A889E74
MDSTKSDKRPTSQRRPIRIELWVRSGKRPEFEPVLERLDDAVERGSIDDYTVETWGKFVDISGRLSPTERRARDKLQSYARWSANRGERLTGLGDPFKRSVGRMGPERVTRRTPRAVMAEYEDRVLSHVTACEQSMGALRARVDELESHIEPEWPSSPMTIEW